MARLLHLDPVGGAAGDMFLGTLAALGLDESVVTNLPETLGMPHVSVRFERVMRGALAATRAIVEVGPREEQGHGRHLHQVLELVDRAIPTRGRAHDWAHAAFLALFEAEARVHGSTIERVHLHEAGAEDALVDVVGTCLGLEVLGVETLTCATPIPLGGGTIRCAHGTMPVPAPAVAELLAGIDTRGGPIEKELVTPTGAALLRALVSRFGPPPRMKIEAQGYGAGSRDSKELANVLRGLSGEECGAGDASRPDERAVAVLETQIDDMVPQDLPALIERLIAEGARDALFAPVHMKKGRPGVLFTVVCDPEDAERLARLLLHETPTLGVRSRIERRFEWRRDFVSVRTPWGPVRVKRAIDTRGQVLRGQPEYEDVRAAAQRGGVRAEEVRRAALDMLDDEEKDA